MKLKSALYTGTVASIALVMMSGCAETNHRPDHHDRYHQHPHGHHVANTADQPAPHRMDPRLHHPHGYATHHGHATHHQAERHDDARTRDDNRHHERTTGDRMDDTAITAKVKTALLREKGIRSSAIKVETFEGVVQLSGFVNSKWQINRAGEVANGVEGVRRVRNDLIHKPSPKKS